ncbi:hypothetical protein HZA41_02005 [Candidatus Peregrinibacteria bacterium]|nr:hypothetical protein [Candidatus Peregrinibacteria bacterium]
MKKITKSSFAKWRWSEKEERREMLRRGKYASTKTKLQWLEDALKMK